MALLKLLLYTTADEDVFKWAAWQCEKFVVQSIPYRRQAYSLIYNGKNRGEADDDDVSSLKDYFRVILGKKSFSHIMIVLQEQ